MLRVKNPATGLDYGIVDCTVTDLDTVRGGIPDFFRHYDGRHEMYRGQVITFWGSRVMAHLYLPGRYNSGGGKLECVCLVQYEFHPYPDTLVKRDIDRLFDFGITG